MWRLIQGWTALQCYTLQQLSVTHPVNIYVLHLLFTQKQENREFINDITRVLTGLNLIQSSIVLTVLSYWFSKREWTMGSTACKLHQFSKSFVSISTGLLISLACLTKYMTFINQLRYSSLTVHLDRPVYSFRTIHLWISELSTGTHRPVFNPFLSSSFTPSERPLWL